MHAIEVRTPSSTEAIRAWIPYACLRWLDEFTLRSPAPRSSPGLPLDHSSWDGWQGRATRETHGFRLDPRKQVRVSETFAELTSHQSRSPVSHGNPSHVDVFLPTQNRRISRILVHNSNMDAGRKVFFFPTTSMQPADERWLLFRARECTAREKLQSRTHFRVKRLG